MTTAVPDEPAHGVQPGGRAKAVRDLPARSEDHGASIDLADESVAEPDPFIPPSVAPTVLSTGQKVAILLGLVALAVGLHRGAGDHHRRPQWSRRCSFTSRPTP